MGKKKDPLDLNYFQANRELPDTVISVPPGYDVVTRPEHYSAGMPEGIEVKDILKAQGLWEAACRANLIKYVLRAEYKNGLEDYKKARQYLDWLIEEKESQNA